MLRGSPANKEFYLLFNKKISNYTQEKLKALDSKLSEWDKAIKPKSKDSYVWIYKNMYKRARQFLINDFVTNDYDDNSFEEKFIYRDAAIKNKWNQNSLKNFNSRLSFQEKFIYRDAAIKNEWNQNSLKNFNSRLISL